MENKNKESVTALAFIENCLQEYANLDAGIKFSNSQMDQEILEIRGKYCDELTTLGEQKEKRFNELRDFALENQHALFSIKRSLETKFGKFGFRFGKARFAISDLTNWNSVTAMLKQLLPQYVKVEYSPAKDKLLQDRNMNEVNKFFPVLGLSVVQDENFYIDLNK